MEGSDGKRAAGKGGSTEGNEILVEKNEREQGAVKGTLMRSGWNKETNEISNHLFLKLGILFLNVKKK